MLLFPTEVMDLETKAAALVTKIKKGESNMSSFKVDRAADIHVSIVIGLRMKSMANSGALFAACGSRAPGSEENCSWPMCEQFFFVRFFGCI